MKKITRTRVTTVTCSLCATEMYSRARHDYRLCECGGTAVDGGFDYLKCAYGPKDPPPIIRTRYVNVTRQELHDDWNTRDDRFGFFIKKGV